MPTPNDDDKPLAYDAYEQMACDYAALIDTAPYNAHYERPTTLSLLPDVTGQRVLDAGCGPGWYAEWLLEHGADVVGIDASPQMIAFARERTGGRGTFHVANFEQPLTMCPDASADVVLSALAIHYTRDLKAVFGEFARILMPGGLLVFSTEHPFTDSMRSPTGNYFAAERLVRVWGSVPSGPVEVPVMRRPLSAITEALAAASFVMERIVEPRPTDDFRRVDPEDYERLMRQPAFLCIRARKNSSAS